MDVDRSCHGPICPDGSQPVGNGPKSGECCSPHLKVRTGRIACSPSIDLPSASVNEYDPRTGLPSQDSFIRCKFVAAISLKHLLSQSWQMINLDRKRLR